jgi:cation diffusion facilitator CzcD-associated flavoprotein CzcO
MDQVEVAIIGAGFGGLSAAIRLKQEGMDDFVVLEREADVGGTWFVNTYPGCQCDVPSNLYSFSFAPKPDWTHSYPEQPQILEYLRDCARRFGIYAHTRLNCEVTGATWATDDGRWLIETSRGSVRARVLVPAAGLLSTPTVRGIPGIERFQGTRFHSAAWNHEHDLRGERVALIGTGATAIQIGPRLRPVVGRMHVFQRTAPWILPHTDRPVSPRLHRLYRRAPFVQRAARAGVYVQREALLATGMAYRPALLKATELIARAHLRRQVADPELRRRLVPDFAIGCKRMLLSDDWYPMLSSPNVELVTAPIERVTERGIRTTDGVEREIDTIVAATGFTPTEPPIARLLHGRDGRSLAAAWNGSPQAYLGTAIAGFPNLFLIYGPNVNLGHSSMVYMLEAQTHYLLEALRGMRRRGAMIAEVRPEVQARWNEEVQRRLQGTIWNIGGCASWYLDRNGRNSVMWPEYTFNFRRRANRFEPSEYHLTTPIRPLVAA